MTQTTHFRIVPLPPAVARTARSSRVDEHGNARSVVRDGRRHQCRVCLRLSQPDEGVILTSYRPIASRQPYAEVGPIFVHEHECASYREVHSYPSEFPRDTVVLRAYDEEDHVVGAEVVGDRPVEQVIDSLFRQESVAYLHARNLVEGCFMFRIERVSRQ